jgi:hypothetical protein
VSSEVCACRHPFADHELVKGFRLRHSTINGQSEVPDIWVCSGGRLVANPDEDTSPWDYVCGCVLHDPPPAERIAA